MKESYFAQSKVKEGNLYLEVQGKIDQISSKNLESKLREDRKKHPEGKIILDFADVTYISSAGLRVLMTIRKRESQDSLKIINVRQSVYDIFEVTGFSQLLEIEKPIRVVKESEVKKIGEAKTHTIYRLGDNEILKVYSLDVSEEEIERERTQAQAAFLCGIPTLISYGTAEYKGRLCLVYELPKASTIASIVEVSPQKIDELAKKTGSLLKIVHTSESDAFPSKKDLYYQLILKLDSIYIPREIDDVFKMIDCIPDKDTLVFGNCTARTIFVQSGDLLFLDTSAICTGNPIFDLGEMYMYHRCNIEKIIKNATGMSVPQAKRFWNYMIRSYFDTDDDAVIREKEKIIEACSYLRFVISPVLGSLSKEDIALTAALSRRDLFPRIGPLCELLQQAEF